MHPMEIAAHAMMDGSRAKADRLGQMPTEIVLRKPEKIAALVGVASTAVDAKTALLFNLIESMECTHIDGKPTIHMTPLDRMKAEFAMAKRIIKAIENDELGRLGNSGQEDHS